MTNKIKEINKKQWLSVLDYSTGEISIYQLKSGVLRPDEIDNTLKTLGFHEPDICYMITDTCNLKIKDYA